MENIEEYDMEEVFNNSSSKYQCLKEITNMIINDLYNVLYENNYDKINDIYMFIQDNINKLDMAYDINEEDIIKYNILKKVLYNIFNLNNPFTNLMHLQEILNKYD